MISWIQKYFQQHFKTVFAILLGVTIISFVFVFNASSGLGQAEKTRVATRPFFSYNLANDSEVARLQGDWELSYRMKPSYDSLRALERATALHFANEWHIPKTTKAELEAALRKVPFFAGPTGEFDPTAYQKFRDSLKAQPGGLGGRITEADIARVVSDEVRIEKVMKLLAGPGYVLASDVKNAVEQADTTWALVIATADYGAFKPEIKPTDAELSKAFEEAGDRYDISPRAVVTYVEFPAEKFLPQVNVTEAEVREYYEQNKARFPKPAAPTVPGVPVVTPPADPLADFAAVRPIVEITLKMERAKLLARRAASDLSLDIDGERVTNGPALEAFLQKRGLAAKQAAPFTQDRGPAELGGSPEIGDAAFKLSKERYASGSLETAVGGAVIFLQDIQPRRHPLFQEVRERVTADYTASERFKRFSDAMRTVRSQIETRVKGGEAFDKAVAAVAGTSGLKLEARTVAPFTFRTRPQDIDQAILQDLSSLSPGQLSNVITSADSGKAYLVSVTEKKAPDLSEANPRFAEMREQIATFTARMSASSQLSDLAAAEMKKIEPKAGE